MIMQYIYVNEPKTINVSQYINVEYCDFIMFTCIRFNGTLM